MFSPAVQPIPRPLIRAEDLKQLLTDAAGSRDLVVVDARPGEGGRRAYEQERILGAVHIDSDRDLADPLEDPTAGGRAPLPSAAQWSATLGRLGVTPHHHVIVYDDQGGANAAARAWWMLRAVGHSEVSVLDGGLDAAVQAGVPMASGTPSEPESAAPYPVANWRLPLVHIEEVARAAKRGDSVIDVRSPERFRGERDTFDPIAGHIPGAVNVPFPENMDEQGRFRPPADLHSFYLDTFGHRLDHAIVYCGSGVTACHTILAMDVAGLPLPTLYVGSWSEWCRSGRPIGTADESLRKAT